MRFRWIITMYLKEMLDLLRDRKTIVSMIVVPTLSMPLMVLAMRYFIQKSTNQIKHKTFVVALHGEERIDGLKESLEMQGFKVKHSKTPRKFVEEKKAQAGIEVIPSPPSDVGNITLKKLKEVKTIAEFQKIKRQLHPAPLLIKVYCDLAKYEGKLLERRLTSALKLLKMQKNQVQLRFATLFVPLKLNPFNVETVNLAPPKKMAGMMLGRFLGYFIIIMMLSGGMYAAIDMTAGEKERKTLEMLLSSPTSREEIVLGKVLATITITFVTAVLTLISFGVTFYFIKDDKIFQKVLGGVHGLPVDFLTIVMLLASLVPLTVLCASILLLIATLAKSFKEAQSYLTPLIMASILPAMVSFIPGIELDSKMAVIPIVNFSLFIKGLLLGEWVWSTFWITLVSNLVYASIAFFYCVKIFKNEKVLFRV